MIRAYVIQPGGLKAWPVTLPKDCYSELTALVEGPIQGIPVTHTIFAYLNDEGKFTGQAPNPTAERVVREGLRRIGHGLTPGDFLVGPVVLVGQADRSGWDTSVPEEEVRELFEAVGVETPDACPSCNPGELGICPADYLNMLMDGYVPNEEDHS